MIEITHAREGPGGYAMVSQAETQRPWKGWNFATGIDIGNPPKRILPNLPLPDNRINRRGLEVVPGGGVEPPRAEARRILSPMDRGRKMI